MALPGRAETLPGTAVWKEIPTANRMAAAPS
jgi:hypothetical protein